MALFTTRDELETAMRVSFRTCDLQEIIYSAHNKRV
jgi:hypothetical protein